MMLTTQRTCHLHLDMAGLGLEAGRQFIPEVVLAGGVDPPILEDEVLVAEAGKGIEEGALILRIEDSAPGPEIRVQVHISLGILILVGLERDPDLDREKE